MSNTNYSAIATGIAAVREGFLKVEVGVIAVATGIIQSWETPMRWSYGSGDNEVSGMFSLAEMYQPVMKVDGKADGKVLPARYDAVATAFGLDWGDDSNMQSKLKMMFMRAWRLAAARAAGVDVRFEDRGRAVSVPVSVAYDIYDTDADGTIVLSKLGNDIAERIKVSAEMDGKSLTTDQVAVRLGKMRVTCKGGKHPVYGDVPAPTKLTDRLVPAIVEAGLMPAPASRAPRTADKAASFVQSLDFVTECLAMLSGSDESAFAPNDETEAKMRAVAESIAAYFAATA